MTLTGILAAGRTWDRGGPRRGVQPLGPVGDAPSDGAGMLAAVDPFGQGPDDRRGWPQPTALSRSSTMRSSSAGPMCRRAKEVAHMSPSSRWAAPSKPKVA